MKFKNLSKKIKMQVEQTSFHSQFVCLFFLLCFAAFSEGYCGTTNLIIGSFVETNMSVAFTDALIKSSYFAGLICSSLLAELTANVAPKTSIRLSSLISLVSSFFYLSSRHAIAISIGNYLLGLSYGSTIIMAYSMAAETCSKTYRLVLFTWVWLFTPISALISCLIADKLQIVENPTRMREMNAIHFFSV